jgi:hypothetical protein
MIYLCNSFNNRENVTESRSRERERERELLSGRREERKKKWVSGKLRPVGINGADQRSSVVRWS